MDKWHPRREDFASEIDFGIICALHLDRLFPARVRLRERMRAWRAAEHEEEGTQR